MALPIAVALVQSRLDYANFLLSRTSALNIHKLQRVQNMASRLVLRNNLSSAAARAQLHWLTINKRVEFKLATITYKLLKSQQPSYLRSLIHHDAPTRLRSSALQKLHQPFVRTAIGERAFCCAAPAIRNSIPLPIRSAPSVELFKKHLKTLYFTAITS